MRTAFLSAPVIVRDLYDTVQSSPGFRDSRTSFSLAGQPSWNRWRFLFPSAATLSSSVAFYRPVSCSIRRDASIPLKRHCTHVALHASFSQICIKLYFQLSIVHAAFVIFTIGNICNGNNIIERITIIIVTNLYSYSRDVRINTEMEQFARGRKTSYRRWRKESFV